MCGSAPGAALPVNAVVRLAAIRPGLLTGACA